MKVLLSVQRLFPVHVLHIAFLKIFLKRVDNVLLLLNLGLCMATIRRNIVVCIILEAFSWNRHIFWLTSMFFSSLTYFLTLKHSIPINSASTNVMPNAKCLIDGGWAIRCTKFRIHGLLLLCCKMWKAAFGWCLDSWCIFNHNEFRWFRRTFSECWSYEDNTQNETYEFCLSCEHEHMPNANDDLSLTLKQTKLLPLENFLVRNFEFNVSQMKSNLTQFLS